MQQESVSYVVEKNETVFNTFFFCVSLAAL